MTIPAGTFPMGCTHGQEDCYDDELEHSVTLTRDYVVGVTEVRQDGYDLDYPTGLYPHLGFRIGRSSP